MTKMNQSQTPKVVREGFGHSLDGAASEMVKLRGDNGFEAWIITYGAALQSIFTPDRAGRLADVVLGRDDLAGYVAVRRFLGATIGRYANRIANGAFELDGSRFLLSTNDGGNALHGGLAGFDRKWWTITAIGENPAPFVTLRYVSPDGEEGYPGRLQTSITYSISGGMELSATFSAETDKPTIVNLTNHSFFNLAGVEAGGGGILDHHLTIAADSYLPVSAAGIPLGAPHPVDGTPFDFRNSHRVGVRLRDVNQQIQIRQGYDHNFCLRGGVTSAPRLAARVEAQRRDHQGAAAERPRRQGAAGGLRASQARLHLADRRLAARPAGRVRGGHAQLAPGGRARLLRPGGRAAAVDGPPERARQLRARDLDAADARDLAPGVRRPGARRLT